MPATPGERWNCSRRPGWQHGAEAPARRRWRGFPRLLRFGGDQPLAAELARQALAEAGQDDRVRAEAAQGLAATLFFMRESLQEELSSPRSPPSTRRGRTTTSSQWSLSLLGLLECPGGNPQAAATLRSVPDQAEQVSFGRVLATPMNNRGVFALWTDGPEADGLLRDARDAAVERGDEGSAPMVLANLALSDYFAGRWGEATQVAEEAIEAALLTGQRHNEAFALAVRALIRASSRRRRRLSRRRDGSDRHRRASGRPPSRGFTRCRRSAFSSSHWGTPRRQRASSAPTRTASRGRRCRARLIRFVPDEIEALVALGWTDEAETLLAWLEERGHALDRASALATAARCRGLLALARRDTTEALASFEEALGQHARVRMPFERARTLLAQGIALRHARRRRDARAAIEEARDTFATLGAALWEEKAAGELGRIGGRRAAGSELTPAEERVAALVANGRTNKEVAAALFLTERTVESHLTHAYRKLGVRSRSELARRLAG